MNKDYYPSILIVCCSIGSFIFGQHLQSIGLENKDKLLRLQEVFVLEGAIDPESYILGPGDKIGLSIITNSNIAYILTITPSGDLWIPDVGAVHISGMNIETAEATVSQFIQKNRFKSADVILVVLNVRNFKIQVIIFYLARPFNRLSHLKGSVFPLISYPIIIC